MHVQMESNVCQAFNVRLMFACKVMPNHKFVIYHMAVMDSVAPPAIVSPCQVIIFYNFFDSKRAICEHNLFHSTAEPKKARDDEVEGRSIQEDMIELMGTIVEAARSRFSTLLHKESNTATVGFGQPEFMHNLHFQ